MTKSFWVLLTVALILGAGLGGAFIGGIAYGTAGDEATSSEPALRQQDGGAPGGGGSAAGAGRQINPAGGAGGTGGFDGGGRPPSRPGSISEQGTNGRPYGGTERANQSPGNRAMGQVTSLDANNLSIETSQGVVTASISEGTEVLVLTESETGEITTGNWVLVIGGRDESGELKAARVITGSEDLSGWLGGRQSADPGIGRRGSNQ